MGTPLPPEEPTAENPPAGSVIDYFLKSPARNVTLEIFDAQQKIVRKFSSEDRYAEEHAALPIAERWFPKPEVLDKTPGIHRFVWSLTWRSSGGPSVDEESEYRSPSGPKVVPGIYTVRLTVDGQTQSQILKVVMDPRSPATSQILQQQMELGQKMFTETLEARRALAEIGSVQKRLSDLEQKLGETNPALKAALAAAQSEMAEILVKRDADAEAGLQSAYTDLASALHVVEGGDRAVPSQAIAVYEEASQGIKSGIGEWISYKQKKLPTINQQLRQANLAPVAISEIEHEVDYVMTR